MIVTTPANPFIGADLSRAFLGMEDTGLIAYNPRQFREDTDPQRLLKLALAGEVDAIPYGKMLHTADPRDIKEWKRTKELILRAANSVLGRYGDRFTAEVPMLYITYPPYDTRHAPALRVDFSGWFKACAPGAGGHVGQEVDLFYPEPRFNETPEQFNLRCIEEYKEYEQRHRGHTFGGRFWNMQLPAADEPELIWDLAKKKSISLIWGDVFQIHPADPVPDYLERSFRFLHFATSLDLPETYEQSRDPNHPNCVTACQAYVNAELEKLRLQGWDIKNANVQFFNQKPVPGKAGEGPKNQFCIPLRIERNNRKVANGEFPPRTQIVMASDVLPFKTLVADNWTQEDFADPMNKAMREIAARYPGKFKAGVATWGSIPASAGHDLRARVVETIFITEITKDELLKPWTFNRVDDVYYAAGSFRGARGDREEPCNEGYNPAEFMDPDDPLRRRLMAEKARNKREDVRVHEVEWQSPARGMEIIARYPWQLAAFVTLRNFIDFTHRENQGFYNAFIATFNRKRPKKALIRP